MDKFFSSQVKRKLTPWFVSSEKAISQALIQFEQDYPNCTEHQKRVLEEKLSFEAARVYSLVDISILECTIQRSNYTFLFVSITGTLAIGLLNSLTSGRWFPIFTPVIMACLTWIISIVTIPLIYNQRIIGAMNSTIASFVFQEKNLIKVHPNDADDEKINSNCDKNKLKNFLADFRTTPPEELPLLMKTGPADDSRISPKIKKPTLFSDAIYNLTPSEDDADYCYI